MPHLTTQTTPKTTATTTTTAEDAYLEYAAMVARLCAASEVHFAYGATPGWRAEAATVMAAGNQLPLASQTLEKPFRRYAASAQLYHHHLSGDFSAGLLDLATANNLQLLLLASSPGRDGRQSLLRRLLDEAPCAVWAVPPFAAPQISRILSPVDFSATAAAAFQIALTLGYLTDAPLLALRVYFNSSVTAAEEQHESLREHEREQLRAFKKTFDVTGVGVRLLVEESVRVEGAIAAVAEAQDADLLVMGRRQRTKAARLLLPGVAGAVAELSKRPLLAVPKERPRLGFWRALFDKQFRRKNDLRFG